RTVAAAENPRARIDDEALECLLAYDWPGNIRQLKNVLRTALILSEDQILRIAHLPTSVTQPPEKQSSSEITPPPAQAENPVPQPSGAGDPFENAEREVLLKTLYRNCWSITNAAASLNTSRNTLYRKMKKHGIPLTRPDNPCQH
ncbi:MAG: helix-turn-helix domain-containing protein, partial [Candidatus Binatia bacterium]